MGTILIVESSEEQAYSIADTLKHEYNVQICQNTQTARNILSMHTPDALILGLYDMDDLLFLQELGENRPCVLVYTACCSNHMTQHLQNLSDFLMFTPCNLSQLADHVSNMVNDQQCDSWIYDNDPAFFIVRQLLQRPARFGYRYLISAVRLYAQNPLQAVTKDIYPAIAKEYGTTAQCVEKAIRAAIEQAYAERNDAIWRRYFPKDRNGNVIRPTNKAFLSIVIRHLQIAYRRNA